MEKKYSEIEIMYQNAELSIFSIYWEKWTRVKIRRNGLEDIDIDGGGNIKQRSGFLYTRKIDSKKFTNLMRILRDSNPGS